MLIDQRDDVRWIRLNRPHRRNAISPGLLAGLDDAISNAMHDPSTAVVVIAGEGPSFCAGADLEYLAGLAANGGDPLDFLGSVSEAFASIERGPKPVVAAVHGHVVAGGLELALACDVVVAHAGTMIGDGHIRHQLLPAGGSSVRLPRRVGESLARRLMLTGELLPAEEFLPSGFVCAVAAGDRFDQAVDNAVASLQKSASMAQVRMKHLLHGVSDVPLGEGLSIELAAFASHWLQTEFAPLLEPFVRATDGER